MVKINTGAMLYDEQIHYDPVGNVAAVTTVLPAGTDNQLFCYDEQNRLTWAGTTTGNPCGNSGATGTFGGAGYTQSFSYDTLNRLTSSPLGNYTYGDSAHLHAATSVSSGSSQYTASYDAAGDMQCRAPSSSTTCSGTQTGQQLTWDVEGRLATWQNTTTTPTVTAKYLYDGEGARVVQQVTDSTTGTTTTTSYIGSLETHTMTAVSGGPTSIASTDYIPAGKLLAVASNGTLSYLATSYQGSIVEALDSTGTVGVTASQLYSPYGSVRYANGSMPTDYGYTGQRADASTGLDYYGARYYDPTVGQFTSADTVADGSNRYGYVEGNPTTATDPSGHKVCAASCDGSEVSNLSPLQWDETYYNLAMTQQGAALTMALWSPDAWKQAQYYAYYYAHTNDLSLIVGQQAIAYREGRPSNDWNASPDLMKEYGELTGLTVAYAASVAGGSVQDLVGDIRTTAYPSLLSPRVSETPSGPPLSQALDGDGAKGAGGMCSFAAETPVATPDGGEQTIGSIKVGDQVEAYDPATGKATAQTVEHVWINHDHDLIDLTLRSDPGSDSQAHPDAVPTKQQDVAVASHGVRAPLANAHSAHSGATAAGNKDETVHTTSEHPWLTTDRGWVPAGAVRAGEQVVRLDGSLATVISVRVMPGTGTMYNLTVGHLHTFAVGDGRYVVHNDCGPETDAIGIGPYASKSIPARGPKRNFTAAERRDVDDIGYATGCHTCGSTNPGTKSGHFVLDHQPPNQFNPTGAPQRLYPQCLACSSRQGGQIARLLSILQDFFP